MRFVPVLAAVLALVALAACERLAGPDRTARPRASGPEVQAAVQALGEDPHMVALALDIPGFGGYWYESPGGRLVVALTADAGEGGFPAARRAVLARFAADVTHASPLASGWIEPPPEVVERVVEHSFIELARHRARLRSALFAIPEVVSLAVDEELNRVVIGLEDPSAEEAVLALVAELAVPAEVVSFLQGSRIRMPGADFGRWSPHPSPSGGSAGVTLNGPTADGKLRAGYQVQADGGSACTLGFTAVLEDGSLVFVSNSHCSKTPWITDSGDWGQPDTNNLVGLEIYDPRPSRCGGNFCRHSDAALMEVSTDVSIALGEIGRTERRDRNCRIGSFDIFVEWCTRVVDPENPTIRIASVRTGSTKKDVLDKIGPTTGWTWGLVTETCEDRRGETGVVITCGDQVDFVTGSGDSGAPVFQYRHGNAEFRGIVYGFEDLRQDSAGRKGWFQDLAGIEWDLGTLTVMDPGSPRVEVLGRNLVQPDEECTWTAYMRRGLEPLSYGWSGILHGSGPSITGVVEESGWLKVAVTDPLDRTDRDSLEVRVGGGPRCRDIDDDDSPGGDTLRLPPPPSGP
ncbi:MAG: hypothetical protein OXQ94_04490 [Gemmatimonadota bacterium]|nr:hypothetical protein [Gemmatimonadota bacterium]MDE2870932.1 hypothetical protein [Gemmatimonadota bacterium]